MSEDRRRRGGRRRERRGEERIPNAEDSAEGAHPDAIGDGDSTVHGVVRGDDARRARQDGSYSEETKGEEEGEEDEKEEAEGEGEIAEGETAEGVGLGAELLDCASDEGPNGEVERLEKSLERT